MLFFNCTPFPGTVSRLNGTAIMDCPDTAAKWYVLRVTYQRELSTKEYLDKLNVENFVPVRVVRRRNSKGQFFRAWEVAVHNYIFIRSTREVIDELKTYKLPMLRYVMHPQNGENQIMIVPEEQMRNFIAVAGNEDEPVLFMSPEEVALSKGDKVRITGGVFEGCRGPAHAGEEFPRETGRGQDRRHHGGGYRLHSLGAGRKDLMAGFGFPELQRLIFWKL